MRTQCNDANKTSYKVFGLAAIGRPVTRYKAAHFTLQKEAHGLLFALSSIDIKVKEGLRMAGALCLSVLSSVVLIVFVQYANGTIIEPAEVAPPSTLVNAENMKRQASGTTGQHLQKRSCTKDSWEGGEILTKPADNVQIVIDSVSGPASVTVTRDRTQSWSTSMSIEIADIHSLGVSADFNESVNSGSPVSITIPEGQSGALGFTATLSCSTGMGHCDSGDMKGEVCCKPILSCRIKAVV